MPAAPDLVDRLDVPMPDLPASLDGLRLWHLTDLHVHRPRRLHDRLVDAAADVACDLLLMTGDYMNHEGVEPAVLDLLGRLVDACRPRFGAFGVFGNHDSPHLIHRAADLPVRWLFNQAWASDEPALPLTVLGLGNDHTGRRGDLVRTLLAEPDASRDEPDRLRLLLSHYPDWLRPAADAGVNLMLSGHTHGGQVRFPLLHRRLVLHNACDLPLRFTSGVMRLGPTTAVVSRGLGEMRLFRVCCPPHAPLLTLRRVPAPVPPTLDHHLHALHRF